MLGQLIDNLSILLSIDPTIIPNIITFVIVAVIIFISLKSQLSWITLGSIYALAMGLLTVLGIDSVFNIISLIDEYIF